MIQVIISRHDICSKVVVVFKGHVNVIEDGETLGQIEIGTVMGYTCLHHQKWKYTVTAGSSADCWIMDK
eukprot:gene21079-7909_t